MTPIEWYIVGGVVSALVAYWWDHRDDPSSDITDHLLARAEAEDGPFIRKPGTPIHWTRDAWMEVHGLTGEDRD